MASIERLIDFWCERRCLRALRFILQGYPVPLGALADHWGALEIALKDVIAFAKNDLINDEEKVVTDAIAVVQSIIYRRY